MKRDFAFGFATGVATILAGAALVSAYFLAQAWFRPMRVVERLSGLTVSGATPLMYERSEHDGWFGDGYSLKVYSLSPEVGQRLVSSCPTGFTARALPESGIPRQDVEAVEGSAGFGCFFRRENGDHSDTILIAPDRIFHLATDS